MDIAGGSINFSSEKADTCTLAEHGIADVLELVGRPLPGLYSAELSLFVLAAGVKLLERERPLLMYLSLTDYIQHKYAPQEPEALRYYQDMDALWGKPSIVSSISSPSDALKQGSLKPKRAARRRKISVLGSASPTGGIAASPRCNQ
jgi:hypothetical protein